VELVAEKDLRLQRNAAFESSNKAPPYISGIKAADGKTKIETAKTGEIVEELPCQKNRNGFG